MRTHCRYLLTSSAVFTGGFALAWAVIPQAGNAAEKPVPAITSKVVSLKATPENKGDWGVMRPYFVGQTAGTDRVFTAAGTILPGKSVHGAHRHVEEEYLLITEGTGTWHLAGREFPAKTGDLLYVEPWIYHGIRNTGDKPLSFLVVKYSGRNGKLPERPHDDKPDEIKD